MKSIRLFFGVISMLIFTHCEKEAEIQNKNYPFVITDIPDIHGDGVVLSADIMDLGIQKIVKYGFVWSEDPHPTMKEYSKFIYEEPSKGIYSSEIKSGFIEDKTYFVRACIVTDTHEIYGNEISFVSKGSLPPVIKNFNPEFGPIGTQVTIEGENFALSKAGNSVSFGEVKAIIDSVSENWLVVTIPKISAPGKVKVSVEIAGMSATSKDSFDLWFPWKRLNDFNGSLGKYPTSFVLNGKGYFGLGASTDLWEYDPEKDVFIKKAALPKSINGFPYSFTANGKGYVLFSNGSDHFKSASELWEYDPVNDSWTRKSDFPGSKRNHALTFSLNGKGYVGCGVYWDDYGWNHYPQDFWEYDPVKDKWLRKADLPDGDTSRSFGFSFDGNGYFGIRESSIRYKMGIYKYSPLNDEWSYVAQYPGGGDIFMRGFVIKDKCYLGLGGNLSSDYYSDFWEFDLKELKWKKMQSCPVKMAANFSVVIDDFGYIGVGYYTEYLHYNKVVYQFDPTKN